MRSGQLRHRIAIQAPTESATAMGGPALTFATAATVWGRIDPLDGDELLAARQIDARATHRVTIRYYPGLTPQHQFLVGARVFGILAVRNLEERNVEQVVLCVEAQ